MYALLRALTRPLADRSIAAVVGSQHLPRNHGCIVVATHTSWLDPLYLTAAFARAVRRRLVFLAMTAHYCWTGAALPVPRKQPSRVLDHARCLLRNGDSVCFFPFAHGAQEAPKTGAARLSAITMLPIIPAFLSGVVPATAINGIASYFFQPKSITITFGAPLLIPPAAIHERTAHAKMARIAHALTALAP